LRHFLITFDRKSGTILNSVSFREAERKLAFTARFKAEREFRDSEHVEVVLLHAKSMDALKKTHSRFFRDELRRKVGA